MKQLISTLLLCASCHLVQAQYRNKLAPRRNAVQAITPATIHMYCGNKHVGTDISPLYLIDNKLSFSLPCITPDSIMQINVIGADSAKKIYGEIAKDGLIQITTKSKISIIND